MTESFALIARLLQGRRLMPRRRVGDLLRAAANKIDPPKLSYHKGLIVDPPQATTANQATAANISFRWDRR